MPYTLEVIKDKTGLLKKFFERVEKNYFNQKS